MENEEMIPPQLQKLTCNLFKVTLATVDSDLKTIGMPILEIAGEDLTGAFFTGKRFKSVS